MHEKLLKVRALIEKNFCKDVLARDIKNRPCNHDGNLELIYDKSGKAVETKFTPAGSWSLIGAIMVVCGSPIVPNPASGEMFKLFKPLVRSRGHVYISSYEDDKTTKQADVLAMIDEAIAAL